MLRPQQWEWWIFNQYFLTRLKHDIQKDIIKQYEKFKSDLLKGKDDDSITNEQAKLLKDEFDRLQKRVG